MHKHVIAVTGVALYALLAVLAGVVTDFHDRFYPQALGVTDTITVDFTNSPGTVTPHSPGCNNSTPTTTLAYTNSCPTSTAPGRNSTLTSHNQPSLTRNH